MPPKSKALTERDLAVLAAAFQSSKTPVDIDYKKLAVKAGYKNADSARICFRDIRKKLDANLTTKDGEGEGGDDDDEDAAPAPKAPKKRAAPKTPAKPKKRSTTSTPTIGASSNASNSSSEDAPPRKKKSKAATASATKPKTNGKAKGKVAVKEEPLSEDGEAATGADVEETSTGMNVDEGEDEGLTAEELVEREIAEQLEEEQKDVKTEV